jgi:SPP1 family predicted phage head-tail adaptor
VKKLKDKKIRIVKLQQSKDEDGFSINEWVPIHNGTLWAYYRQLSGKEFFASAAVQHDEECLFIINYRDDITADMEIEFKNKYYITRIDDFEGYKSDIFIYAKLAPK